MAQRKFRSVANDIMTEVRKVPGMRAAPTVAPETAGVFPFAAILPGSGNYRIHIAELLHGFHDIRIEVHVQRADLERDLEQIYTIIDEVPIKIHEGLLNADLGNVDTFDGGIDYDFGPLSWNGVETLGIVYTISNVKAELELSKD